MKISPPQHIRRATTNDASRLAEILIFAKRVAYRDIFKNDLVSFGKMQVYPLAKEYIDSQEKLKDVYVYDDEFVKGMLRIAGNEISELYIDPFFQGQKIGSALFDFAKGKGCNNLWVLEKNIPAISFYTKHGFTLTNERKLFPSTSEYIVKMEKSNQHPSPTA